MIHRAFTIICAACFALALGCGTEEKPPAPEPNGDLYPLTVGDFWLYEETDTQSATVQNRYEVVDKIDKDFAYDAEDELSVFVVKATLPSGGGDTDTSGGWREEYIYDDGNRAVRKRQDVYDDLGALTKTRDYEPGFLRFDRSKITVGENWDEEYTRYTDKVDGSSVTQDTASYLYEVLEPETMTVPAGTFDCTVLQRTSTSGSSVEIKIYYFAPGVGKVKEITEGTKEEVLTEYKVASTTDGGV